MQRYQNAAQDALGNVIQGMSVSVFAHGTQTPATIYSDNGVTTIPNPTSTDALGMFAFYAANNRYDISLAKVGLPTTQLLDVILEDPSDTAAGTIDVIATVAALKALAGPQLVGQTQVLGYYTAGDGGGGLFRWNSSDVTADNGGTVIAPNAGGTGRWNRIVDQAAGINVRWFGAVGDGVTNDTAAIQAALDSFPDSVGGATSGAGGYTLYFPPGIYIISSALKIGKPAHGKRISLVGSWNVMTGAMGASIRNITNSNVDLIDASSTVIDTFSMYGLALWGNGKGTGTGRGVVLGDNSSGTKCLFDSQISHCWFTGIPDAAIAGENIDDYSIFSNGIENSSVGIRIKNPTIGGGGANKIQSNTVFGCAIGLHCISGSAGGGEDDNITNNIFWNCGTNPGGVGDDTHGGIVLDMNGGPAIRDALIANNTFRGCVNDILLFGHNGSNSGNTGVNDICIKGNISDRGFRRFLLVNGANNVRILNNTVDSCNQEGIATIDAIQVTGTSDSTYIAGNSVSNFQVPPFQNRYGLQLDSATTNTTLGGNDFAGATATYNIVAGATFSGRGAPFNTRHVVTYSASMTLDASIGSKFDISATNGTAFTINAPTNPIDGHRITITIRNTSGGALGAVTWDAVFKMSAWTQPANANSRSIDFVYNGTNQVQASQTGVDVPN